MLHAFSRRHVLQAAPFLLGIRPMQTLSRKEYAIFMVADNDSEPVVGTKHAPKFQHFASSLIQTSLTVKQPMAFSNKPECLLSEKSPPISVPLHTGYSYGGRGAELSDMISTSDRLFTFDDRTGIVFEVLATTKSQPAQTLDSSVWEAWYGRHLQGLPESSISLVPRWILSDGAGTSPSGFKCEWSALKDDKIIVGSHGYEVWRMPPYLPGMGLRNVQYIKILDPKTGSLQHVDWSAFYNSLAKAAGVVPNSGGYVTHEAAAWSDVHKRWFFMPRRFSPDQPWDPDKDTERGCNFIISALEERYLDASRVGPAEDVEVIQIRAPSDKSRGYSAMRFLPGSNDQQIVAAKTVEPKEGPMSTYLTVLTVTGEVLLPETLVSSTEKLEGIEVVKSA